MAKIGYAQSWEDPKTLTEALAVTQDDDVVSIASAGDNTFALLLGNPRSVRAVDRNPAQIFLMELKMRAIQRLEYDDFVGFVGARKCTKRLRLYEYLRPYLTGQGKGYWDTQTESILTGVIHCGKFERYFSIFRQCVLPLIHGRETIHRLLTSASLDEQRIFYYTKWSNRRWRWFFHIFFGRFLLGHLGRDPAFFQHVKLENVAAELVSRTERGLTNLPLYDNFFVEYILTGQYTNLETVHPYLRESNFYLLRDHVSRVNLVVADLQDYLHTLQPRSVSKFNLSDIFEYMSEDSFQGTLKNILSVCRPGAMLVYWSLFVPRSVPATLRRRIDPCSLESEQLFAIDRTFFYGNFHLWRLMEVGPDSQQVRTLERT